jgi:hypothetical protein
MRTCGLRGIPREKTRTTTIGDGAETPRPADKVNRQYVATAPNQLRMVRFASPLDTHKQTAGEKHGLRGCGPMSPKMC